MSKLQGGGLQKAVNDHGGIAKLRCLHARRDTAVQVEFEFKEELGNEKPVAWRYSLGFKRDPKHPDIVEITTEQVWKVAEASKMNHEGTKTRRDSRRRKNGDEHLFCQMPDNQDIFLSSS